ncbi:hypothetical protein [Mesorhizobium sp. M0228]|uniref:hypothetical protein n=1 Tax=Mesorhizobium sp. M0228 TaxID=2956923 RepID=UPI00333A7886
MIQHLSRPVTLMAAILVLSTAAEAEPVTYAGKLGKSDIVVEFTGDPAAPGGPLAGRYFYRSKGVDIPLQARSQKAASSNWPRRRHAAPTIAMTERLRRLPPSGAWPHPVTAKPLKAAGTERARCRSDWNGSQVGR